MAGIPGDATKEDTDRRLLREFKAQIAGIGNDRLVTVDAATAALVAELLPSDEELEETDEEKQQAMKVKAPAAAPAQAKATPKETRSQLEAKTKEELLEQADDEDVDVASSWTKAEIIDALVKAHK
jgi:hypothetical protein